MRQLHNVIAVWVSQETSHMKIISLEEGKLYYYDNQYYRIALEEVSPVLYTRYKKLEEGVAS